MRLDNEYCILWMFHDAEPLTDKAVDCPHLCVRVEGEYNTLMFRCKRQGNIALGRHGGQAKRNPWCHENPPPEYEEVT